MMIEPGRGGTREEVGGLSGGQLSTPTPANVRLPARPRSRSPDWWSSDGSRRRTPIRSTEKRQLVPPPQCGTGQR